MEQARPELSQPGEAVVCTMLERLQNTMETSLTSLRTELCGLARQVGSPGRAATSVTVVSAVSVQVGECKVELEQLRERQTGLRPSPGHRHPSPHSQSPSPRRSPAPVRKVGHTSLSWLFVSTFEDGLSSFNFVPDL